MNLLFLTDNFPPESNAPASRTYEHCREWVKAGLRVTVITCAPNFPTGKVYPGYRNRLYQTEWMDGIRVIRVWSYMAANAGFAKRVLDYVSFGITSFLASLFVRTDLIVATSPQFFTAVSGCAAGFCKRKPWIMEVRDLWPESIRAVGAATGRDRLITYLERLELFLYRRATKIVVVTKSFKKNISARGVDPDKIHVVTNGVLPEAFPPREKDEPLFEKLGLEGKFVVGYFGTHGLAHKLGFIMDCAPEVPGNVHFLFVGGGAEKAMLQERQAQEKHLNITLLPPVVKEQIGRYLSLTDVALVPLRKSKTFKTVIPSKIFESASMGKPILLGVKGEAKKIIKKYGAGLCYAPENRADFLRQLERLVKDSDLYDNCRRGTVTLAGQYHRRRLAEKMLTVLKHTVASKERS